MRQISTTANPTIIIVSTLLLALPMAAQAQAMALPMAAQSQATSLPVVSQPQAATVPDVIITELQTSNKTAGEEFIELYNTTSRDIDFADVAHQSKNVWKLQFFSSTKVAGSGFSWDPKTAGLTTISLTKADNTPVVIAAHSYFLVTTAGYKPGDVEPDFTYSSGHMSDSGGGVQLVDVSGSGMTSPTSTSTNTTTSLITIAHSHLGWFNPTNSLPLPAGLYLTPASGSSLQRTTTAGGYGLAGNAQESFISSDAITPKEAWILPPELVVVSPIIDQPSGEPQPTLGHLLPVQITELFPNPASPQADDKDEYVELFNPNNQIINLNGYSLQTGLKFSYSYTIQNLSIEPQAYLSLTSGDTHIPLSNTVGQARLINNLGQVVSQTSSYEAAPPGQAWALQAGVWQWTTLPTSAARNIIIQPVDNFSPIVSQVKAAPLRPNAKLSSPQSAVLKAPTLSKKPTPSIPKTTAVKAAKTAKPSAISKGSSAGPSKTQPALLHTAILVGVGLAAVVYGLYEYRKDIANKFYLLRRNRAARRAARHAA